MPSWGAVASIALIALVATETHAQDEVKGGKTIEKAQACKETGADGQCGTGNFLREEKACLECYGWMTGLWAGWESEKGCGKVKKTRTRIVTCESSVDSPDIPHSVEDCKTKFGLTTTPNSATETTDGEDYRACEAHWHPVSNTTVCKQDCVEKGPGKLVRQLKYVCKATGAEGNLIVADSCDEKTKPAETEDTDEPCAASDLSHQAKCQHNWAEDDWAPWSACLKECKIDSSSRTRGVKCQAQSDDGKVKFVVTDPSKCPIAQKPNTTEKRGCSDEIDTKAPREWELTGWNPWDQGKPACGPTPRFRTPKLNCTRVCPENSPNTKKRERVLSEQCSADKEKLKIDELTQNETHVGLTDGKPQFQRAAGKDGPQVPLENINYQACQYFWVMHPWDEAKSGPVNPCGGTTKTSKRKVECRRSAQKGADIKTAVVVADGCCDESRNLGKDLCLDRPTSAASVVGGSISIVVAMLALALIH